MRGQVLFSSRHRFATASTITALALSGMMASTALAQTSEEEADGSTSSATTSSTSATDETATSTTVIMPSTGAGSSTAGLPTSPAKKSPYKLNAYTDTTVKVSALQNKSGGPSSLSYLQGGYGLSDTKTVSVRQEFTYAFPAIGGEREGKTTLKDTFIGYVDSDLAKFAGDASLTGVFRAYLPTGDVSRNETLQNGRAVAWFIASKPLGKVDISYSVWGSYYNQTQDAYQAADGSLNATADYDAHQWASVSYNVTPKVSVAQDVGTLNSWTRPGPNGVERSHNLLLESHLTYKPVEKVSVGASVLNYPNIWNSPNPFDVYRGDDTTFRVNLSASM